MNAVSNAEWNVGPIVRRLASWTLVAAWLLAGWSAMSPLAAQETAASQRPRPDGRGNRPRGTEPRGAVNNDSGTLSTGNQISYNGGQVLLGTTHLYYIWYGTWDASSVDILTNFANHIGGSPYFNINTGYFDGSGASISNSVSLAGSTTDNYSRGKILVDNDIWLIVTKALGNGSLPIDANGVYFVLTAGDVKGAEFPDKACGWHTYGGYSNTKIHIAFIPNPDPNGLNTCAEQTISPNGNAGADAMASTIAHELDESVTDPNLDAWYDSKENETADKCAWTFGTTYTAINGSKANMQLGAKDYLIQQNWVNSGGGFCALSASPGPDFALSPTVVSQTVSVGGTTGYYAVSEIAVKGFTGTITYSVIGLPPGAAAGTISTAGAGASFLISTTTAGAGTYQFTISGTSGALTRTVPATLIVTGEALAADTVTIGTINPEPSQAGQPYFVNYSVTSTTGTPTGNVTVSDGSVVCTATVAAGRCSVISSSPGTKTITVTYLGDGKFAARSVTKQHVVVASAGGSLSHLTSGGGWETTFQLVNLGPGASAMSLNFFGDSGSPLSLPYTFPQSAAAPFYGSGVNQTLGSNSLFLVDTNPPADQPLVEGWAKLSTAGSISAYEIFRYATSGQEAVVPLETRNASSYFVMFDNTTLVNTLGTGVAIANLSPQTANVALIIRDDSGTQISSGTVVVAAMAHTAFTLSNQYPITAGKRGTIQFFTPAGGQISVLNIRANGNAFTTVPVLAAGGVGGGAIAHVVSGGGWRSVFSVTNPGVNPANISLSFFDELGNPLSLPLTFLQTGATSTASNVTQTLEAGASLVIQAQGLDANVVEGSAQLTTNGSASGFALFRYDPDGQEASVPFESRNASAYMLAFDNTQPLATGVAISNLSAQAASVGMILRDDAGTTLQTTTIPVPANGHYAFVLGGVYPLAAGKRGTVEFDSSGAQISVIGIRANGNAFTSIPVLTR